VYFTNATTKYSITCETLCLYRLVVTLIKLTSYQITIITTIVPVVPLFSTQHEKGKTLALSHFF